MSKEKENKEIKTRTVESTKPLSVIAGGGMFGFGGVGIYNPQENKPSSIGLDLNEKPEAFGIVFPYDAVGQVIVNDKTIWINNNHPKTKRRERQDVSETGMIKIEFFETEELKKLLDKHRDALKFLGLNL